MTIEEKRYGMVDILKLPLKCVPFFGMVVAIQILIMSILPTIHMSSIHPVKELRYRKI